MQMAFTTHHDIDFIRKSCWSSYCFLQWMCLLPVVECSCRRLSRSSLIKTKDVQLSSWVKIDVIFTVQLVSSSFMVYAIAVCLRPEVEPSVVTIKTEDAHLSNWVNTDVIFTAHLVSFICQAVSDNALVHRVTRVTNVSILVYFCFQSDTHLRSAGDRFASQLHQRRHDQPACRMSNVRRTRIAHLAMSCDSRLRIPLRVAARVPPTARLTSPRYLQQQDPPQDQGGAGVRGKKTRFGRRVVTSLTALYIIISHYKHYN